MSARVEFTEKIKRAIGGRVNYVCSNPGCFCSTTGPHWEANRAARIGEAAHICAASEEGPRYDPGMTDEERGGAGNGIWLCANCHTMVDDDAGSYPVATLQAWKSDAEALARSRIGRQQGHGAATPHVSGPLVVSNNQSGGQTALVINNYERQRRTIDNATIPRDIYRRMLGRAVEGVVVVAHGSDSETVALAEEFARFVKWIGWSERVEEIATLMATGISLRGVRVQPTASDVDDPLRALAEWVHALGFRVEFVYGARANRVEVGHLG